MVERVDAGTVPVAPIDVDRVAPDRIDLQHLQRGLVHLEWVRRSRVSGFLRLRAMRAGAGGARTLVAQVSQRVLAVMVILPVDFDPFRFGDGDVLGLGGRTA